MLVLCCVLGFIALAALIHSVSVSGDVYDLRKRIERVDSDRNAHVLRYNHEWLERMVSSAAQGCDHQRARLDRLASALGYEWEPEGKTEARWRRKNPFTCSGAFGSTFEWVHADEPPALRNRRKGDKKKGRNK